jgi:aspartate/methionine/tyrosine aminotransferase
VLADEIYSRIYFDEAPVSITTLPGMLEKTIILDGFSKTYAMTGWRMGYGVMPEWLVDPINKLMVNSNSCTSSHTQRAGIAALNGPQDEVVKMTAEFRRRRDAFCAGLNKLPGVRCSIPGGAFYAYPNITGTGLGSEPLADALLQKAGVACLSGTAFGAYGEGYLRFSIANSYENLMAAIERIGKFLTNVTTAAAV